MKLIKLTKGYFSQVDDEDYEKVCNFHWIALVLKNNVYGQRGMYLGYDYEKKQSIRKVVMLHRVILGLTDKSLVVDHIDHNGLNNQKSNLRICTHKQNCQNTSSYIGSTSQYVGVHWNKINEVWQASIKSKYIGSFKSEIEAAKARDKKAFEMYGNFANLNFKDINNETK